MTELGNKVMQVCGAYSLFMVVFGTIGNILTFSICWRKDLRSRATFVFMAFMVLTDTCSLYFWNLNHFLLPYYGYIIESYGIMACRAVTVLQYTFLQSSAWLLVIMNVERCVLVCAKSNRKLDLSALKSSIISILVLVFVFSLNFHLFFTINNEEPLNRTNTDLCHSASMNVKWQLEHMLMYSLLPWIILVIANTILIIKTLGHKMNKVGTITKSNKRQKMSLSIVLMTILFIVCTLPGSVIGTFFLNEVFKNADGLAILFVCDAIAFSYHSLNFLVFMIWNKKFRSEIGSILGKNVTKVEESNISRSTTNNFIINKNSL